MRALGQCIGARSLKLLYSRWLALALLVLMTGTVIVGSIIPQASHFDQLEYAQWRAEHPELAAWSEATGLNQVFASPWFWALAMVMAICILAVNGRRAYRLLRPSRQGHSVDLATPGYVHRASFHTAVPHASTGKMAARVLRAHGYRVAAVRDDGEALHLVAEKGRLGRWGSVIFHLSLLVVFAGGVMAATGGSSGMMVLTEGQTLSDRPEDYLVRPARRWGVDFSGAALKLEQLALDYYNNWDLSDAAARFSIVQNGAARRATARENEPLEVAGKSFVLSHYGFAPLFVLRDAQGGERFHSYVNLTVVPIGRPDTFRIPGTALEVGVRLYPDAVAGDTETGLATASLRPRAPVAFLTVLDGERELFRGPVSLNGAAPLPEGALSFAGLRYWARLRVVQNPGEPVLFAGFWLAVIGLLLRFGLVERRVVVRIAPRGAGALVAISGRAAQFDALYGEEFGGLVAAMADEVVLGAQRDAVLLDRRGALPG